MASRKEKLKSRAKKFFHVLNTVVQFSAALIALLATSLAGLIFNYFASNGEIFVPLLYFFFGSLVTFLTYVYIQGKTLFSEPFRSGYKVENIEHIFKKYNSIRYLSTDKITIRAIRPGVEYYLCRYFWSGKGTETEPIIKSPNQKWIGHFQQGEWRTYYIFFENPLQFGDTAYIEVKQEFFDNEGVFQPFFGAYVTRLNESITFRVFFPKRSPPKNPRFVITKGRRTAGKIAKTIPLSFDKVTGEVRHEIARPKMDHDYSINWS